MNVVLLAAGLGSRLGTLTRDLPKALIPVAGKPLLLHALSFATCLWPTRIIVVGGFCFPQVKDTLASFQSTCMETLGGFPSLPAMVRRHQGWRAPHADDKAALPIELVENTQFRDGNLVSLLTAKPLITEGFLVMNVDHIYRPAIAEVVVPEVNAVTAFIDTDRKLGNDDMKVERGADGRVVSIAKTLTKFDCGYVGMTRVPTALLERYFEEADRALAEEGRAIHVERILGRLAKTDFAPTCRDISGHGWLEVDTPDERAAAEAALAAGRWA
ncbi:MAG TPA: NTP transferase domain-containing protein [Polyangia bacterium]